MRIDAVQIIKDRLAMRDILIKYGVEIDRSNRIRCPLHNGSDYNCGVKENYIHCFVCNESADQIAFVQKFFSLGFQAAVKKIDEDFSLGLFLDKPLDDRQRLENARRAFLLKKEEENKKKELETLLSNWLDAHEDYARLERQKKQYKPKSPSGELHPLFVEAIKELENAKYRLNCAEEELRQYEKRDD